MTSAAPSSRTRWMPAPAWLGMLVVLVALATVPGAKVAAQFVRDDPVDERWVWANLTWKGDHGSISWSDAPATPATGKRAGDQAAAGSVDEFVSDPSPRRMDLNASRLFQLDLRVVKGTTEHCQSNGYAASSALGLRVELLADGKLIAGALDGQYMVLPADAPPSPDGFETCRYRMAAEVPSIEKGARLTLRFVYLADGTSYTYGFGGEHPSVLRFPIYAPDEVFYRDPKYAAKVRPTSQVDEDVASVVGFPLASLAVAPAAVLRGRGGRRLAAIAVALGFASFAGCVGGGPRGPAGAGGGVPPTGGAVDSTVQSVPELELAGKGNGSILGVVHDASAVPVGGVFFVLVGTSHSTSADYYGQFKFLNVKPGRYTLRGDREGFTSVEAPVEVVADKVTRLDVTLAVAGSPDSGVRPHYHDYWNGETSREAFNGTINCDGCPPMGSFFVPPTETGDHNTVIPGTYRVDVTFDWDPAQLKYNQLGLMVQANEDPSQWNWTSYLPRPPGQPFHVQANWERDDVGHQLFSTWAFSALGADAVASGSTVPEIHLSPAPPPPVHVRIDLHKGVVPLEPAHPDHWRGRENLTVDEGKKWRDPYYTSAFTAAFVDAVGGGCWTSKLYDENGISTNSGPAFYWKIEWGSPSKVVPQGTNWLDVRMKHNEPPGTLAGAQTGIGTFNWLLWYKTGQVPPRAVSENHPDWRGFGAGSYSSDGRTASWRIPIKDVEADGIYNKRSSWNFFVRPDDVVAYCENAHLRAAEIKPLELEWFVAAHRDPLPK